METAGGVDDQHIAAGDDRFLARFFRQALNGRSIRFSDLAFIEIGLDRRRDNFQLLARGGTINVHRDEQGAVSTVLQPIGELAGGGGLARALQTGHQDDSRRLRSEFQLGCIFAESLDQFVAEDLDDLLAGRKGGHHLRSDGFGADAVDEVFDDLEIDVRFKQRQTNLLQRLIDIFFREDGLPAQGLEGALEFFLEVLEHKGKELF